MGVGLCEYTKSLNCMFQISELYSTSINYTSIKLFNIFMADQNKGSCGRDSLLTLHKYRIHYWPSCKNLKKYINRLIYNIYFLVALDLSCSTQDLQFLLQHVGLVVTCAI